MEAIALVGLVILAVINLALYGICLALVVAGVRGLRRGNMEKGALLLLGLAPFAWFAFVWTMAHLAVGARSSEVASWPRKGVTAATRPAILVVEGSSHAPGIARTLVSAGPFERAYGNGGFEGWFVYERRAGPDCPSSTMPRSYGDWLGPDPCATAAKSPPPTLDEPHLRLLLDLKANYYRDAGTTGVVAGSILELRWSDNAGGAIVAFEERPIFHVPMLPPLIMPTGFVTTEIWPDRYKPTKDPVTFVREAVGAGPLKPRP